MSMTRPMVSKVEYYKVDNDLLRLARRAARMSQVQVAALLGIHENTISRLEQGHAGSYDLVRSVCDLYGLDLEAAATRVETSGEKRGRRKIIQEDK